MTARDRTLRRQEVVASALPDLRRAYAEWNAARPGPDAKERWKRLEEAAYRAGYMRRHGHNSPVEAIVLWCREVLGIQGETL